MDAMYADGHAYLSPESFVVNPESLSELAHARREVRRLRRHVRGGSLLEIGPGRGTFLRRARDMGFDVHGVELSPVQADFIRSQLGIPCAGSLDAVGDLGVDQFDALYHCSVLSHFHDPVAEFVRFNRLLRPGGLMMFETGNWADVNHKAFRYVDAFQYPDHLFFFGVDSIDSLLSQTGFRRVRTARYSNLPDAMIQAQLTRVQALARGSRRRAAIDQRTGGGLESREIEAERKRSRVFSGPGLFARQALDLFYYGLQTTVGSIGFAKRNLQTLIVVAEKV
jgi:SAM-dependent methyltransferase